MHILFITLFIYVASAFSHPDEVKYIPGLKNEINFRHYSGYLNATDGKFLHYWFVESQRSPSSDPVVLWMNGGPGCSSLDGFLTELGPFHVSPNGKSLYMNEYSWNKVANVIFLEAPAGVGFSYSLSQKYETDDDITSFDNYIAIQHFFMKFPEFKHNEFYITGESYGGIYIPTLSVRVLTGSANINFKGFAIGNGFLDATNLTNSIVLFAYYHGLLGSELWENLGQYCCNGGTPSPSICNFASNLSDNCNNAVNDVMNIIENSGLNVYNLYDDCALSSATKNSRDSVDKRNLLRLFPKSSQLNLYESSPPCIDSSATQTYLNRKSVRAALHIPAVVQPWTVCSADVEAGYHRIYNTMRPQILQLIQSKKLRGLIYNGDVDMACNFLGDEWFTDNLGLKVLKEYSLWKYGDQIAGFVKYFQNLTFLTVKGSGHMVPQDKPGQSLKMITQFLKDEPY